MVVKIMPLYFAVAAMEALTLLRGYLRRATSDSH